MSRQATLTLLFLGALMIGCESESLGPEQSIDGSWAIVGIYADLEGLVRCRIQGEATITAVGGGTNTLTGSGSYTLRCDVDGDDETLVGGSPLQNATLTGENLHGFIDDCGFVGTYQTTRSTTMKGHSTCNIAFTQTGQVGVIGSWEAERIS